MNRAHSPLPFRLGVSAAFLVWVLAVRLVWEQTVWTWERGAQMVGFSLMHSEWGGLLVLGALASLLWPVLAALVPSWRRSLRERKMVVVLSAYALAWAVLLTPYGFWQRAFIWKFEPPLAAELMTYAAASGDLRTVRAFLEAGTPVDARDRRGTALHAAATQAELEVMAYLIARGADVNAIDVYGESPMSRARNSEPRSAEALALLERHGGRLVTGTKEQRKDAMQRLLREDMERIDKEMPR